MNCFGEGDKKIFQKFQKINTKFTFESFNNMRKISNKIIDIWSSILNSTDSILMLKGLRKIRSTKSILNKFKKKGPILIKLSFGKNKKYRTIFSYIITLI